MWASPDLGTRLVRAAGADLVVTSLDEVAVDELAGGRLCRRPT